MNFGAKPLDGVSCCDWAFVEKVRVILRVCWLGDNELVFLLLSGAIVRLVHSTCNSLVIPSSPPPCWHKPLLAELRIGTATKAPRNKKVGVGGAGDGLFVGAEFRTVLVRFLFRRSFSRTLVTHSTQLKHRDPRKKT